jgi:hypothetical protein
VTLFQKPRANPGVARVVFRYLALCGGRCERDMLLRTVAPYGAGGYEPGEKDGDARDETLTVCEGFGLVTVEDGVVALAVPETDWDAGTSVPAFRRVVRRALFAAAEGGDPFAPGPAEFAGAVAWLLTQDPLRPFHGWAKSAHGRAVEPAQDECLPYDARLVTGDRQWTALVRWAGFLGFLTEVALPTTAAAAVPDPSVAVADEAGWIDAPTATGWLARLAEVLPVVDGGAIRVAVEARMRPETVPPFVSPALSLALERLRVGGRLTLENVPDARADARVVLHVGDEDRLASAVTTGAANDR